LCFTLSFKIIYIFLVNNWFQKRTSSDSDCTVINWFVSFMVQIRSMVLHFTIAPNAYVLDMTVMPPLEAIALVKFVCWNLIYKQYYLSMYILWISIVGCSHTGKMLPPTIMWFFKNILGITDLHQRPNEEHSEST